MHFRSRNNHSSQSTFRTRLERLESREMFCSVALSGTNLFITGDHADNQIYIEDTGYGKVHVSCDGPWDEFENIEHISLDSGIGHDIVFYNQWTHRTQDIEFDAFLGDGDDHFYAGVYGDTETSTRLSIKVDGERGADNINVDLLGGIHDGAAIRLDLDGGESNDKISVLGKSPNPIDGDLLLRAAGGDGDDRVEVIIDVAAGSTGRLTGIDESSPAHVSGGSGSDTLSFVVRGEEIEGFFVNAIIDGDAGRRPVDEGDDRGVRTNNVRSIGLEVDCVFSEDDLLQCGIE